MSGKAAKFRIGEMIHHKHAVQDNSAVPIDAQKQEGGNNKAGNARPADEGRAVIAAKYTGN